MSGLRDARLRRALESAPDAHMRPDAKTRAAIRAAALGAVAPAAAPAPWWRTVWDSTGRRGPWNAAFATVLLASLVTVLWYDREVPDARTDKVSVAPVPPSALPAPAAPPPAAAPAPSQEPSRAEKPVAARRETPVQAPRRKDASPAPAAPAPAAADAAVAAAPATPSLQDQERRDLAKAQEPVLAEAPFATGAAAPAAPVPPPVVAQAAPPAAAPMARSAPAVVAPAPAPAPAAAAPATRAAEVGGSNYLQRQPFESARLMAGPRSAEVPPAQSRRLVELAQAVARAALGGEPLAAPVTLRIELRQGTFISVLEVAGPQVRWNGLTGRPDPALLLALEQEAARLLAR